MRGHTLAILPALVLATSAYAAGERVTGQNRDYQTLTEVTSNVPGQQGRTVKQFTNTFRIENASDPTFNGTAIEIVHQEINGSNVTARVWGETRSGSNNKDIIYWAVNNVTGQLSGETMTINNGQFEWTGGTGKFQNIKGGGSFNCQFGSGMNGCNWDAQAENIR